MRTALKIFSVSMLTISLLQCSSMFKKGDELASLQKFDEAIAEYNKILEVFPQDHEAYVRIGDAYRGKKQFNDAIGYYEEALQLKPDWLLAQSRILETTLEMGSFFESNKDYREAVRIYEQLKEKQPDYVPVYEALSKLYGRLGEFDKAIENYEHITKENPDDEADFAEYQRLMKLNYEADNLFDKALEEYEDGYFYESANSFEKVFELKPDHKEAKYQHHIAKGRHHLKRDRVFEMWEAILAFGNAMTMRPESAEPIFYMAQAYRKKDKNDYDTPIEHFKKVLELEPDSGFARESRKAIKELTETKEKMEKFLKKKKGGS